MKMEKHLHRQVRTVGSESAPLACNVEGMKSEALRGTLQVEGEERLPSGPEDVTSEWLSKRLELMAVETAILVARTLQNGQGAEVPSDTTASVYSKPVISMSEAADLMGVSTKRLSNILYEEKARLGRLPNFVCDAGGTIQRRIITDELLKWLSRRKRRPGRPLKNERGRS